MTPESPRKRTSTWWDICKSRHWTPFLVLSLIIFSLGTMGASTAVIVLANGDPVSSWEIAPPVILAILSSLFNIFLATLLSISVASVWWRSASRGTTIDNLHLIWERGMGTTFFSAIWSGSDARRVALAAIVIALVKSAHNPLLQNSLRAETQVVQQKMLMKVSMAHEIPDGLFGNRTGSPDFSTRLMDLGSRALRAWYFNDSVVSIPAATKDRPEWDMTCPDGTNSTCGGWACPSDSICKANIKAPGISYNCRNTTEYIDLSDEANIGETVFHIGIGLASSATPGLTLTSMHIVDSDEKLNATRFSEQCTIRVVVKEYSTTIRWSELMSLEGQPRILANYSSEGDLLYAAEGVGAGPLATMARIFGPLYNTTSRLETPTTVTSDIISTLFWRPLVTPNGFDKWVYDYPVPRIRRSLNNWLIYAGQATARVSDGLYDQPTIATRTTPVIKYTANYRFLAAALAIMAAGLLSVIVLSIGWQGLYRTNATLSPIETARAFGAPLLMQQHDISGDIDDLLRNVGKLRVRYDGNVMVANSKDETGVDTSLLSRQRL